jgi:hypothetical protein
MSLTIRKLLTVEARWIHLREPATAIESVQSVA